MVVTVPSRVFPLPGWSGPIQNHWGAGVGGSDLMVTPGSTQPIVSITNGTVVWKSTQQTAPNSGGNSIEIKGTDGLYYYYAHMRDASKFNAGDTVKSGEQIGIVGSTGNASAASPHLHIGIGHSIFEGVGPVGGTGIGFNAVGMLRDLFARANIPALATTDGQVQVGSSQSAGTIQVGTPPAPTAGDSIIVKIRYLAELLRQAGVDPSKIPTMVAISLAENGNSDPKAKSSTSDYGLWQINWPTWGSTLCQLFHICSIDDLMDPANNAKAAAYVLAHQGYTAWSTYKVGSQKQYQPTVDGALSGQDLTGDGSDTSGGTTLDNPAADCPEWVLMDTDIVGNHVRLAMPDLGCVLLKNLQQLIDTSLVNLKQSVWEHTYDWGFNVLFAVIGIVFIFIAAGTIAGSAGAEHPEMLMAMA